MTTYTETVTVTHAMRRAGILGEDETPSSDSLAVHQKIYRSRLKGLQIRGLNMWGWSPDTVPEELLDPLAEYMALFFIPTAGGPRPSDAEVNKAEGTLRALCADEPSYDVIGATYY